jgi:hypothetical protein
MEEESMSPSPSAADPSKLPMVMQNPKPTTTASNHWTHFVLLQLFLLAIKRRVLEKQPLLVVLSSYVHLYVFILKGFVIWHRFDFI